MALPTSTDVSVQLKGELPANADAVAIFVHKQTRRGSDALETLPKTIEKLQAEIAKQQRLLDDPDLYRKDRKKFDEASAAIAAAQTELAAAEDRWLELEVLREEIEQA